MYTTIDDFITDWEEEAASTVKVLMNVDYSKITDKVNDHVRTLGQAMWHITRTLTEMPASAKIIAEDPLKDSELPDNIGTILAVYQKYSSELVKSVKNNWKDADLTEMLDIYGQKWEKKKLLSALVRHQIHHRAQMTVMMRLLGMKVPGVYGPSQEEWAEFGMEPQE